MYKLRDKIFSKIARYLGFPLDSNDRATNRKVCLGPGTEIQGTGNLFWRKIGQPISSPFCWDFFADLGAGLWMYDVEITQKLKSKTTTVDEIDVPGRGVAFHFVVSDVLQFFFNIVYNILVGAESHSTLKLVIYLCWYQPKLLRTPRK